MSITDRGLRYGLFHPRHATNENTGTHNRAFFECPECGERWSYDCNLIDYVATCPECGARNIEPHYVEEIESEDRHMSESHISFGGPADRKPTVFAALFRPTKDAMRGRARIKNANCDIIGYENDVLEFDFKDKVAGN